MGEAGRKSAKGPIEIIPIHFDVPGHQIPLSTFTRTAAQTEAVIRSFNSQLFDGRLKFELLVLPPDDGTFLSRLGIVVLACGAVWTFTESDIGKAFIKGLTTREPAYWAELAGEGIRQQLAGPAEALAVESKVDEKALMCRYEAVVIAEAVKSFLQKDAVELEAAGITPRKFRDAYAARNQFYQACSETPDLRAIGFEEAPHFPIPRSDFARLQVAVLLDNEDEEEPWLTGIVILKVTSPNWDREDRQRQWKGKDGQGRERYFRIEDEHFWSLVKAGQLNTHIIDTIKVQWAFHGKAESPRNCRVLTVLEFNNAVLSDPLDDNALRAILGSFERYSADQGDLFKQQMG